MLTNTESTTTDLFRAELLALKWRHAGQACITANRVFVQKGVYDKFANILLEKTKAMKVGHGASEGVQMGPVTTPRSLDKAEAQVADAKKLGGQVITGGNKLMGTKGYEGYFFEPTLITGAKGEMLIAREETFAPIMALFEFDTEDEAVQRANDTSMGLASCKLKTRKVKVVVSQLIELFRLLHEEHRQDVASVREPRSRDDWYEHWQLLCRRDAIRWYQGVRLRQRSWQGCR